MDTIAERTNRATFCLGVGTAGDVDFLFACDVFGEVEKLPRHAKAFGNLFQLKVEIQAARVDAFIAFQKAVTTHEYPTPENFSTMLPEEQEKFLQRLSSP